MKAKKYSLYLDKFVPFVIFPIWLRYFLQVNFLERIPSLILLIINTHIRTCCFHVWETVWMTQLVLRILLDRKGRHTNTWLVLENVYFVTRRSILGSVCPTKVKKRANAVAKTSMYNVIDFVTCPRALIMKASLIWWSNLNLWFPTL